MQWLSFVACVCGVVGAPDGGVQTLVQQVASAAALRDRLEQGPPNAFARAREQRSHTPLPLAGCVLVESGWGSRCHTARHVAALY